MLNKKELLQGISDVSKIVTVEQCWDELADFLIRCDEHGVKTVLEVGSRFGGSLSAWLNFLPTTHLITVDKPWEEVTGTPLDGMIHEWRNKREAQWKSWITTQKLHCVWGSSHDDASLKSVKDKLSEWGLSKVDMVFIDGDHTYNGVKQDYISYGALASKIIAFNDFGHSPVLSKADCDVETFWHEVKIGKKYEEIYYSPTYGIGVIYV